MRLGGRDMRMRLLGRMLSRARPDDNGIYDLCKKYVDRYRGENNDDIVTNGELLFMREQLA
jgi:hypothetical protein